MILDRLELCFPLHVAQVSSAFRVDGICHLQLLNLLLSAAFPVGAGAAAARSRFLTKSVPLASPVQGDRTVRHPFWLCLCPVRFKESQVNAF